MAKKKTEQEQAEPEKTIGKGEAQAASNGAPPEASMVFSGSACSSAR